MAKKRKKKDDDPRPQPAPAVGTSLRGLLRDAQATLPSTQEPPKAAAPPKKPPKAEKVPASGRPSDGLRGDDRIAFMDAMGGVRPVGGAPRAVPEKPVLPPAPPAPSDADARARLGSLVAGAVRFEIERHDGEVRALRAGASPSILRGLLQRSARAEATLDLHGMRGDEAEAAIVRFVRAEHRRGVRRVCIVHGKGLHSEGGASILSDRAIDALTETGAAPLVIAFATAHHDLGGSGALIVELSPR